MAFFDGHLCTSWISSEGSVVTVELEKNAGAVFRGLGGTGPTSEASRRKIA